jgi:hypothetical protein
MKPLRYKFLFSCVVLLLTGCVSGADLTLISRDSGKIATGSADRWTRAVTINLNRKVYQGQFVYVPRASPFAGVAAEGSAASDGNMIAEAEDGSSLHCSFTFSGWSGAGTGECRDNKMHEYDLQLTAKY